MPNAIRLHNERVVHLSLERMVWPSGPLCPHCGETSRLGRLNGLSTPIGAWKCYSCRKPFTIRNGTIFHNSHVPLHVWLQALYLLTATRQKMGSQRLAQILGVSVRTAWHLKQKIVSGLAVSPLEVACYAPWQHGETVVRCEFLDCQVDGGPGSASCVARFERFMAALEGIGTAETDALFIQALRRLLATRPERLEEAGEALTEVQLELGLLDDEPAQRQVRTAGFGGFGMPVSQAKN
ncbi:ISSpo8, transposase [Bosea sp. LC85]|uniref:transposase n=1 Tax=Bosea sp. LC85 TaxID=1502851 RepID=UPI0004E2D96D|nr:transposase [Bosea sp. LC85]KFC75696.1 ISSpo8, transposase [Bosea sp. LC85]